MPVPTVLLHKLSQVDVKCIQEMLRIEGLLQHNPTAAVGLTDTVVELLSNGSHNKNRDTALHLAFYKFGPSLIFDSLLTIYLNESTENLANKDGLSFFHMACTRPYVELVHAILLSHRVDVNCRVSERSLMFSGYSPLHFAVQYRQYEVTKLLLKYNANVGAQDCNCFTPLHIALEQGNKQMINLLLDHSRKQKNLDEKWELSHFADCDRVCQYTNYDKLIDRKVGCRCPFGNFTSQRFAAIYGHLIKDQVCKDTQNEFAITTIPRKRNSVCFNCIIGIINIFVFTIFMILLLPVLPF